jgi:hypothetical protein
VSSGSESSSATEANSDGLIEEIIFPCDEKTEDENKATAEAVPLEQHTTTLGSVAASQPTTATVLPRCRSHEDDLSHRQNTENISLSSVSSCAKSPTLAIPHDQEVVSATRDSQAPPRCGAEPSVRRGLRSRRNTGMDSIEILNPENSLSSLSARNLSSSGLSNRARYFPETVPGTERITGPLKSEGSFRISDMPSSGTHTDTGPSRTLSSPITVSESPEYSDQDILESSVPDVPESSLVKKVQNSLSYYEKSDSKEGIGNRPQVNEDFCEKSNFSALREEPAEGMDVEKCVCVSSAVDNVLSPSSDSLSNITANCYSSRDVGSRGSEDQERNINAFNCDRSNYERTLRVRKVKRACSRLPFYIPPYKMDIYTYITYFKRRIKEQAARLIEVSFSVRMIKSRRRMR